MTVMEGRAWERRARRSGGKAPKVSSPPWCGRGQHSFEEFVGGAGGSLKGERECDGIAERYLEAMDEAEE